MKNIILKDDEGKLKEMIKKRKELIEKIQKLSKKKHFLLIDKSKRNEKDDLKDEGKPRKLVKR